MVVIKNDSKEWALQRTEEICQIFSRETPYKLFWVPILLNISQIVSCAIIWFYFTFQGYNKRKVEMTKTRFAETKKEIFKDRPCHPTIWGKTKGGCHRQGWEDITRKDGKVMGASLRWLKREALNRLAQRKTMHS